jgi:hypothetical protein
MTIGVAFLSAWMLAAPRCWFCALACKAMIPSKSTAAVKVIVTFRTRPSSCSQGYRVGKRTT